MPKGCIFADKGPAIFVVKNNKELLLKIIALINSKAFQVCVEVQLAAADSAARSYEVGILQNTPFPDLDVESTASLATLAHCAWSLKRNLDTITQTSHAFILPALLQAQGDTLSQRAQSWANTVATTEEKLADIQTEIDRIAFELYGISPEDMGSGSFAMADEADHTEDESDDDDTAEAADLPALVEGLLEYSLGVALGRFDLRLALGERDYPPEPDPFDPLPACSPGMLVTAEGLPPATAVELPPGYPISFPFSGILPEDEGHADDVVLRLQRVMACLWGDAATDIEQEAVEGLNSPSLRAYLTKGNLFFAQHIKRYSKSRRKAPIYWQIAIPSVQYSVWLYYHRFTKDTFYTVLNDYIKPKLLHEETQLTHLLQAAGPAPTASQRKDIAAQESFVAELRAFRDEVAIIAPLWNPNLNDGVIINFAPLWRLVPHHKPWQKECKACWDKLVAGDYDWAHLAMHLWPERVVPKCQTDRSLAIAHGLEAELWQEDPSTHKWQPRTVSPDTLNAIIQQRTSPAVKEALNSLQSAPTPSGNRPRRRRS